MRGRFSWSVSAEVGRDLGAMSGLRRSNRHFIRASASCVMRCGKTGATVAASPLGARPHFSPPTRAEQQPTESRTSLLASSGGDGRFFPSLARRTGHVYYLSGRGSASPKTSAEGKRSANSYVRFLCALVGPVCRTGPFCCAEREGAESSRRFAPSTRPAPLRQARRRFGERSRYALLDDAALAGKSTCLTPRWARSPCPPRR